MKELKLDTLEEIVLSNRDLTAYRDIRGVKYMEMPIDVCELMLELAHEAILIRKAPKEKKFTAKQIAHAFKNNEHQLKAVEAKCGNGGPTNLLVMNTRVLMRYMLRELGFSEKDIENLNQTTQGDKVDNGK